MNSKSVGVMGDGRTYERVVALRAVESVDFMTADWFRMPYDVLAKISNRIINEVSVTTSLRVFAGISQHFVHAILKCLCVVC